MLLRALLLVFLTQSANLHAMEQQAALNVSAQEIRIYQELFGKEIYNRLASMGYIKTFAIEQNKIGLLGMLKLLFDFYKISDQLKKEKSRVQAERLLIDLCDAVLAHKDVVIPNGMLHAGMDKLQVAEYMKAHAVTLSRLFEQQYNQKAFRCAPGGAGKESEVLRLSPAGANNFEMMKVAAGFKLALDHEDRRDFILKPSLLEHWFELNSEYALNARVFLKKILTYMGRLHPGVNMLEAENELPGLNQIAELADFIEREYSEDIEITELLALAHELQLNSIAHAVIRFVKKRHNVDLNRQLAAALPLAFFPSLLRNKENMQYVIDLFESKCRDGALIRAMRQQGTYKFELLNDCLRVFVDNMDYWSLHGDQDDFESTLQFILKFCSHRNSGAHRRAVALTIVRFTKENPRQKLIDALITVMPMKLFPIIMSADERLIAYTMALLIEKMEYEMDQKAIISKKKRHVIKTCLRIFMPHVNEKDVKYVPDLAQRLRPLFKQYRQANRTCIKEAFELFVNAVQVNVNDLWKRKNEIDHEGATEILEYQANVYRSAAAKGDVKAQYRLAKLLWSNASHFVSKDSYRCFLEAVDWLIKAVQQDSRRARHRAQRLYRHIIYSSRLNEQQKVLLFTLLESAFEHMSLQTSRDKKRVSEIKGCLGYFYVIRAGIVDNPQEKEALLRRALERCYEAAVVVGPLTHEGCKKLIELFNVEFLTSLYEDLMNLNADTKIQQDYICFRSSLYALDKESDSQDDESTAESDDESDDEESSEDELVIAFDSDQEDEEKEVGELRLSPASQSMPLSPASQPIMKEKEKEKDPKAYAESEFLKERKKLDEANKKNDQLRADIKNKVNAKSIEDKSRDQALRSAKKQKKKMINNLLENYRRMLQGLKELFEEQACLLKLMKILAFFDGSLWQCEQEIMLLREAFVSSVQKLKANRDTERQIIEDSCLAREYAINKPTINIL